MKKSRLSSLLLASLITIGLAGCGGNTESTNSSNTPAPSAPSSSVPVSTPAEPSVPASTPAEPSVPVSTPADPVVSTTISSVPESVIKSLTAVNDVVEIKIGEAPSTQNYYNLEGNKKSLTAKQKKVTITSSDETILKISSNFKTMTAVGIGSAVVTVVSQADETKSCTFTVNVTEAFFDREVSSMSSTWDIAHEMDAENPYIKVDTDLGAGIYIRNSDGLKWFVETDITVHSISGGELWPKFGIVANTTVNTTEVNNNKLYYFLDAPMNIEGEWKNFGVCEVANGVNWAWNAGVGNNEARHNDAVYTHSESITYEKTFRMGMIRDGFNCHLYVNGSYIKSVEVLGTLFGNYDEATQGYTAAVNTMAGFFSFNSTVTFSNYNFVNDAAVVDGMISAIEPDFATNWADD